jgi:signal transduction histidine kinase
MKTAGPTGHGLGALFHRRQLRIGTRLTVCFLVIALSMIVADALAFWHFRQMVASSRRLGNADQTLLAIVRLRLDVGTLRKNVAALESSHDAKQFSAEAAGDRQNLLRDVEDAEQALRMAPEIERGDPTIPAALQTLKVALPSQLDIAVQLSGAGDWTAVGLRLKQQIQDLIDLCSSLVARVDKQAQQQRAKAIRDAETARQRLFVVAPLAGLLTFLLAVFLGWYVTQSITVPLAELALGADALARGDFRHEVNVGGNDELAVLGQAFNRAARQLHSQFEMTLEARVSERTRIARELHDTLLQSFHGLLLRFQTVSHLLPERAVEAKEKLDSAIDQAAKALTEGREAVQGLRDSTIQGNDLALAISTLGEDLANDSSNHRPSFGVAVEGESRNLHPIVRDEIYKIAAEALRNAFRHAQAMQIEVEIRYDAEQFRLRVRDDGRGMDPTILSPHGREGHFGLPGMQERATLMGAKLTMWSEVDAGTEVELCVPGNIAYATEKASWFSQKFAKAKS